MSESTSVDAARIDTTPKGPELSQPDQSDFMKALIPIATIIVTVISAYLSFGYLKDEDASKPLQVLLAVAIGTAGVFAVFWSSDRLISALPTRTADALRPWVFIGPAMVLLSFFLVYPAVNTLILSFQDNRSQSWVGLDNFNRVLTERPYQIGLRNSAIWVILVPLAALGIGLAFATLADKLSAKAESAAKSMIFMPMAISFVGATVVFTFIYSFRAEGFGDQIGLLNSIWSTLGGDPVDWLALSPWNNLFLMVILIWLQTGFSMVILSSAIKGVPSDLLEAARIDGATEWQVFWRIIIPTIASTIAVVWTTVLITVWKVYDIVAVTTGGRSGTQVVAQQMVQEFFTNRDNGVGAALAVLLFVAVIPILVINIRRFQAQEELR